MSATGDSTRDWLLKKLLKASRNLAEQQVEIETLKDRLSVQQHQLAGARANIDMRLAAESIPWEVERAKLLERIKEMAPEKQFVIQSFTKNGRNRKVLVPTSVSSAAGVTTITLQR